MALLPIMLLIATEQLTEVLVAELKFIYALATVQVAKFRMATLEAFQTLTQYSLIGEVAPIQCQT
jgi:hypothetical protein